MLSWIEWYRRISPKMFRLLFCSHSIIYQNLNLTRSCMIIIMYVNISKTIHTYTYNVGHQYIWSYIKSLKSIFQTLRKKFGKRNGKKTIAPTPQINKDHALYTRTISDFIHRIKLTFYAILDHIFYPRLLQNSLHVYIVKYIC